MTASLKAPSAEACSTAKEKYTDFLEAAKARAMAAKGGVNKMVLGSITCVQEKMSATREAVSVQFAKGCCTVDETRAMTQNYVTFVQDTLTALAANYSNLSTEDVKAFVREGTSKASERAVMTADTLLNSAAERYSSAQKRTVEVTAMAAKLANDGASKISAGVRDAVDDKHFQVSAASAAGGAVALGTTGAATGLAAGGAIGAAVGLGPALFTLGLSIPIGAAIGSGLGLAVGTVLGSATGAVGGGLAGWGTYSKKEDIGKAKKHIGAKAAETAELVRRTSRSAIGRAVEVTEEAKAKAYASAGFIAERASAARCRLVGSGTGGTEAMD